jgi:hypothetical protein
MLWLVAATVCGDLDGPPLEADRPVPSGFTNALEAVVEFIRDSIVPNVGRNG